MNTFGRSFRFTSFGESHGPAIGGIIDGCPAGLHIDFDAIQNDLARRAGKQTDYAVSNRAANETDQIEWLSGLLDGTTLGTPIAFLIRNTNLRSQDYDALRNVFRPGHADATYIDKYGIRDHRGGGRASARETAARVVAGSIAKQILHSKGITISAQLIQVGNTTNQQQFAATISNAQSAGDSVGGIIACNICGMPAGLGEPIFGKMQAQLAFAMLSINACKGFEYGAGFAAASMHGSMHNTLPSGGMLGGITDGTNITFRVAFKPTPSIALPQQALTVNGEPTLLSTTGRHDPCLAVRAIPVVEAMAALTIINSLPQPITH